MTWPRRFAALHGPSKDPRDYRAGARRADARAIIVGAPGSGEALALPRRHDQVLHVQVVVGCVTVGGGLIAGRLSVGAPMAARNALCPVALELGADRVWSFGVAVN